MKDPKTSVRVVIKNDMKYSLKNALLMRAFGDVLQLRYTESLREKEGGTYGADLEVLFLKNRHNLHQYL